MSFPEAVRSVYRNYANFSGRASRAEYWWFQLFFWLVLVVWVFSVAMFGSSTYASPVNALIGLALLGFVLATVIPSLAVSVRRMHDWGHSGWWLLISLFPYIGGFIVLVFMLMPSSPGYNSWGAPYRYPPVAHRARYWGWGRPDAWQQFVNDAQRAAASGFQPVWQEWRQQGASEVLEVDYARAMPHPLWPTVPSPAAPWGGYPPPPPAF